MIMAAVEPLSRFEQLFWRPTGIMGVFGPEYKPTRLGWFTAVPGIMLLAVAFIGVGVPVRVRMGWSRWVRGLEEGEG